MRSNGTVEVRTTSNPAAVDTDGDGLDDDVERAGWTVDVVHRLGYEKPYSWDAPDMELAGTEGTMQVSASPLAPDTDGDGLSDAREKRGTHTDPRRVVTYGLTTAHERTLRRLFHGHRSIEELRLKRKMGLRRDDLGFQPENPRLTDASDDFDVVLEERAHGFDELTILWVDGAYWPDYWLGSEDELTERESQPRRPYQSAYAYVRTDPWDPDSDDDGLTDGREINGFRTAAAALKVKPKLDPWRRDTDGDRLGDLAEFRFEANPTVTNPDGDQFGDFVDPMPRVENIPPAVHIEFHWPPGTIGLAVLNVSDAQGVRKVVATFDQKESSPIGPVTYRARPGGAKSHRMEVKIPTTTKSLTLTLVDTNGNKIVTTIQLTGNGNVTQVRSKLVLAAAAPAALASPEELLYAAAAEPTVAGEIVLGAIAVGVTVGVVLHLAMEHSEGENTGLEPVSIREPLPMTPEVKTYPSSAPGLETAVTLREGFVQREAGYVRGYGQQYIEQTTGVELAEEEVVIERVVEVKDATGTKTKYLIGRAGPKDGGDLLILRVIGTQIVSIALQKLSGPVTDRLVRRVGEVLRTLGAMAFEAYRQSGADQPAGVKTRALKRLENAEGVDTQRTYRRIQALPADAEAGVLRSLAAGNVTAQQVSRAMARYEGLSGRDQETFEAVLAHEEYQVRDSWLQVSGKASYDQRDILIAVRRARSIRSMGHQLTKFLTSKRANKDSPYDDPPHMENTIVIEFEVSSPDTFYRVYDEEEGIESAFLVRKEQLDSFDSKEEILDKLALRPNVWGNTYDSVGKLELDGDEDLKIRVSTVGEMPPTKKGEYRQGGATQFVLQRRVGDGWVRISSLSEYFNFESTQKTNMVRNRCVHDIL